MDSARLLQAHGHRSRLVPHRRLADRGHPPRARREAEPRPMFWLDDRSRQDDGPRTKPRARGSRRHLSRTAALQAEAARQEGGDLCRRLVQGILADARVAAHRHGDGHRRLADRRQGGLQNTPGDG